MPSLPGLTPDEWAASPWVLAPAALILWIAVFLVVKTIVLGGVRRVAAKTPWAWDDILVESLSSPLLIAIVASGLLVCDRILPLAPEWDRAFDVLFAFSIALALVLFVDGAVRGALDRLAGASTVLQGARGLIQTGLRAIIVGIGLLIFLDSIGISITPILASLGVGSLAVALALQDTLANLFAGLYMIADKPIEPGHLVRLPGGEEGYVSRVGWRSTRMRMTNNNMLVTPNSRLAGGIIINYALPDREVGVPVSFGVHYDSDLDLVERVTLEVSRDVMRGVTGGVAQFEPALRFQGFGDSAILLQVVLRAREFEAVQTIRHEFVKRLWARYRRERIVVPYPIRTLDFSSGRTGGLKEALGPGPESPAPDRPPGFTRPGPVSGGQGGRGGLMSSREILYLSRADVETAGVPMTAIIERLEVAFREKGLGRVEMPPKPGIHPGPPGGDDFIHAMPAFIRALGAAGVKWIGGFPDNLKRGLPYITGLLILNDPETGLPKAVMDATWITAMRTGAASALAAKRLARPGAASFAILGCGVQARTHLEAMAAVTPSLRRARAYDIHPDRAARYCAEMGRAHPAIQFSAVATPRDAVEGADIVVTAGPIRARPSPVIEPEGFAEGSLGLPLDYDSDWK